MVDVFMQQWIMKHLKPPLSSPLSNQWMKTMQLLFVATLSVSHKATVFCLLLLLDGIDYVELINKMYIPI